MRHLAAAALVGLLLVALGVLSGLPVRADVFGGTGRQALELYGGNTLLCSVVAVDADRVSHTIHSSGSAPAITRWSADRTTFTSTGSRDVNLTWGTTGATGGLSITALGQTILAVHSSAAGSGTQRWEVPAGIGSGGTDVTLHATKSPATGCDRDATAKVHVRVVTAPTLTAFTASAPSTVQSPFQTETCSVLTWTATPGDPTATWTFTQTGYYLPHLPSDRRATPASSPQRVCTSRLPGQSTTITLTGRNEAGSASSSVTVAWPGQ